MDLSEALDDWNSDGKTATNNAWPGQPGNPTWPGGQPGTNPTWPGGPQGTNPTWPGGQPGTNPTWPGGQPGTNPTWPGGQPGTNPTWPGGQPGTNPTWPGGQPGTNPTWPGGQPGTNPTWPGGQPGTNPTWPGGPSGPSQPAGPGGFGSAPPTAPQKSLAVPYQLMLPQGVYDKLIITIAGTIKPNANKISLDFLAAKDLAFHFNPRFNEEGRKVIVRNSCIENRWGKEERDLKTFPFVQGQPFEMKILCTSGEFRVAVNNSHLLEFKHRLTNLRAINILNIYNDLSLSNVQIETMQ